MSNKVVLKRCHLYISTPSVHIFVTILFRDPHQKFDLNLFMWGKKRISPYIMWSDSLNVNIDRFSQVMLFITVHRTEVADDVCHHDRLDNRGVENENPPRLRPESLSAEMAF